MHAILRRLSALCLFTALVGLWSSAHAQDPFGPPLATKDDWKQSGWFSWYYDAHYPYVLHPQHGWVHVDPSGDWVWIWDAGVGEWMATSGQAYPAMYTPSQGIWLRYHGGAPGDRVFVDLRSQEPYSEFNHVLMPAQMKDVFGLAVSASDSPVDLSEAMDQALSLALLALMGDPSTLTCPVITREPAEFSLSDPPPSIIATADFGDGCALEDDSGVMAGSLQVNISDLLLGADGIGANISMVADNLRRDGLALMDGAMSLGLDLMMSEEETETETHWVTTSLTDLLVNLDITGLATMGQLLSGTIAVDGEIQSIVHTAFETYEETEETMGDLTVTIGNFNSGEIDVTSGTIRLVLQMPGTTALYADMETSDGPVSLEMDIYQSPDGAETLIDTIGVAEVMGYSLQITGLSFQPLQCEDYPVAGTIVIGRAGMEYVITITGDCAGGFTIEKR